MRSPIPPAKLSFYLHDPKSTDFKATRLSLRRTLPIRSFFQLRIDDRQDDLDFSFAYDRFALHPLKWDLSNPTYSHWSKDGKPLNVRSYLWRAQWPNIGGLSLWCEKDLQMGKETRGCYRRSVDMCTHSSSLVTSLGDRWCLEPLVGWHSIRHSVSFISPLWGLYSLSKSLRVSYPRHAQPKQCTTRDAAQTGWIITDLACGAWGTYDLPHGRPVWPIDGSSTPRMLPFCSRGHQTT
ncbi:hypothetical protein DL93DRAFT_941092 [Clavulina sp. PMI_390]|nr:hypothetical protein DL93DRAFT_941092 [Clavulina sp. PMI_390]